MACHEEDEHDADHEPAVRHSAADGGSVDTGGYDGTRQRAKGGATERR
jgi:hypothetical protein